MQRIIGARNRQPALCRALADHHSDMGLAHINRGLAQKRDVIRDKLFCQMGPEPFSG